PGSFSMHPPESARTPLRPETTTLVAPKPGAPDAASSSADPVPDHVEYLMPVLMEATGFTRRELHQDMHLRHDLSLRSSRFPLIMHAIEKRYGLTLCFDDLLGVATIRDLAWRIHQLRQAQTPQKRPADAAAQEPENADGLFPSQTWGSARGSASHPKKTTPPESRTPEEEATLDVPCHFSHFREIWLTDARPWPDSPHSCLLPSMQLAALMEAAAQLFPGLTPAGAEELSFTAAECPSGVTREGHVHCRALRAQTEQRRCQGELCLRDLLPNGRAKRSYSPICSARVLLMPETSQTLMPILPDPAPVSVSAVPAGQETLQKFYEGHTGLGPSLRLLTELYALEEKRLIARMRVPAETDIAGLENSRYIYPVYVFEAAAQAALLLALKCISGQNVYPRLTLSRIAAAYFSRNSIPGETFGIELREDADVPHNRQFDAELRDSHGHIVLALRGMRLDAQ
ncbi:MAG: polyketide synthase dehydratase domain-containing protein, partial [Desulfovibrionaceae bacterium]|nr:polyketide synthase dehydratase domain-containing protein [Desulfovibrionaceae bacterium]